MSLKKLLILLSILFVVGSCFFLIFRPGVSNVSTPEKVDTAVSVRESISFSPFAPFTSETEQEAAKQQPVSTWEEWRELRIKILSSNTDADATAEEFANILKLITAQQTEKAERFKAAGMAPPPYPVNPLPQDWEKLFKYEKYYQGPQTPEALIAEFNEEFMEKEPKHLEWDEHYPKEAWIQRLLDKGVEFKEYADFSTYLKLRSKLIKRKDDPREWTSGLRGIPPTNNFSEFEDAFIDRKIWEYGISDKVASENPNELTMVVFPPNSPDKYLPVAGNMVYVRLDYDAGGMTTWGSMLTGEQQKNLLHKGIEPEGMEIVYVDDDYNIVEKPAEPFNREKWNRERTYDYVPEGLRAHDGTIVSPERYQEITGKPMSTETLEHYNAYISEDPASMAAREAASAAQKAAREAAKSEYEKFAGRMRQLESFATMSDAEIEKHLERQFRKQFLPEHPIEQLEQITPERLERALGTLFQHGFEDGMRHIRKDNATLADLLERHFGKRVKPPAQELKPPQRPAPPKPPSEPPASSDETQ